MVLKTLKILVVSIYAVGGGLIVLFAIPQVGWKALSVATGSMTPAIPQGSLVIIHHTPLSAIKVGDVVTYTNPAKPSQTITHRVVAENRRGGIPVFTTKGDANKVADPQIAGGSIVGQVDYHVPQLGKLVSWLRTPLGLVLAVALPALIIIVSEFQLMVWRLQAYAREEAEERAQRRERLRPTAEPQAAALGSGVAMHSSQTSRLRRKPRPIIWVAALALLVPTVALGVQGTRARLAASAKLTDNTIATVTTKPPTTSGSCPSGTTSVSISHTGPGSTNNVTISTTCVVTSSNNTSISVSNDSSQTATSGSVTNSDNTSSGTSTSGGASNSSSSSTTITTGN